MAETYRSPTGLNYYVQKFIRKLYKKRKDDGMPDADLLRLNYEKLWEGIQKGWDGDLDAPFASPEQQTLFQLRHNAWAVSVFKMHHLKKEVHAALFNEDGTLRTFAQFRSEALKLSDKYNRNWLQAEYQTAVIGSQSAARWLDYAKRGGSLILRSQRDGRVRDGHKLYDGAQYPVDHPFWDTWYPPNGWRCRCFVVWRREATTKEPEGLPENNPFPNNPGKTGMVFPDSLPYFEVEPQHAEAAAHFFGLKPPVSLERFRLALETYNRLKDDPDYEMIPIDHSKGGLVFMHKRHGKQEKTANTKVAKQLAEINGDTVVLAEWKNLHGIKEADGTWNGLEMDMKIVSGKTYNNIDGALRKADKQAATAIIELQSFNLDALENAIRDRFKRTELERLVLIFEGYVLELERKAILSGSFVQELKKLGGQP